MIAYPTEAVYGLGCLPWDYRAVARLLSIKKRSVEKGLIIVAADLEQVLHMIDLTGGFQADEVFASWPGPITWVLPASDLVPGWIRGSHPEVAIRLSAHPLVRQLCESAGPLVSTSANPEGCPPAADRNRVRSYFGTQLDYIVPGRVGTLGQPTEIRHAVTGRVLRPGSKNC